MNAIGDANPERLIAERTREVFAPADRARMVYLVALERLGRHCRFCGREVADRLLKDRPGVCGYCWARGKRPDPEVVAALAGLERGTVP